MSKEFKRGYFDSLIEIELEAENRVQEARNHVDQLKKEAEKKAQLLIDEVRSDDIFKDIISQHENKIYSEKIKLKEKYEKDISLLKEIANLNRINIVNYIIKYVLEN